MARQRARQRDNRRAVWTVSHPTLKSVAVCQCTQIPFIFYEDHRHYDTDQEVDHFSVEWNTSGNVDVPQCI